MRSGPTTSLRPRLRPIFFSFIAVIIGLELGWLQISAYVYDEGLKAWDFYEPALNYHSRIDDVNDAAYMGGHHKYLFDEENLLSIVGPANCESSQLRRCDLRSGVPQIRINVRDCLSAKGKSVAA